MDYITSRTHRFINIRQFPSDYILDKFHKKDPKAIKKFYEYVEMHHKFYESFIEFVTGNPYSYYHEEYMFSAKDCSKEEVHEMTGIKMAEAGNYVTYCIPKTSDNEKIYDWLIDNIPCTFKVLKRTRGTFMDHGPTTYHRESCRTPDDIRKKMNKK